MTAWYLKLTESPVVWCNTWRTGKLRIFIQQTQEATMPTQHSLELWVVRLWSSCSATSTLPIEPPPQSLIPVVTTVSWWPEDLLSMVSIVSRWPADLMSLNFTGSLRKWVGFQGVTSRSPGTHRLPVLGRKSTSGLANEACGFTQTTDEL